MNVPESSVADLIRQDLSPTLTRLFIIFGMSGLAVKQVRPRPRPIEYAPRTWCDLHLEALNYGLLAALYALVGVVIWLVARV